MSLVIDISAGDGKIANIFSQCVSLKPLSLNWRSTKQCFLFSAGPRAQAPGPHRHRLLQAPRPWVCAAAWPPATEGRRRPRRPPASSRRRWRTLIAASQPDGPACDGGGGGRRALPAPCECNESAQTPDLSARAHAGKWRKLNAHSHEHFAWGA